MILMRKNDTSYTADNLSDVVIDQLRNEALDADDSRTAALCDAAFFKTPALRQSARRQLAEHLNAVAAMEAA